MRERTADEWMAAYLENGNVCGDTIQTTQMALEHPQVVEAGYLAELDDPRVGHMIQIGPLVKLPGAPASISRPAPRPGEHTDEVFARSAGPAGFSTVRTFLEGSARRRHHHRGRLLLRHPVCHRSDG